MIPTSEPVLVVLPPGVVALIEAEAARREIGSADALAAILAETAPEALAEAARSVLTPNAEAPPVGGTPETMTALTVAGILSPGDPTSGPSGDGD